MPTAVPLSVSAGRHYVIEATSKGSALGKLADVTVAARCGNDGECDREPGNVEEIYVVGTRIVTAVDVRSTESATNFTREDLDRLPVERDIQSVALMAPGRERRRRPVRRRQLWYLFGGSSIAENTVYINGLNVTDFYNRVGSSSVPYAFYKEFQVKTGGYSVEFGRTTGGVINAVTRSGTNEFDFGTEVAWEPHPAEQHDRPLQRGGSPRIIGSTIVRQHERDGLRLGTDRQGQAVLLRPVRSARLSAGLTPTIRQYFR